MTGGFPWAVWGLGDTPSSIAVCAWCAAAQVGIKHSLAACPGTACYRAALPQSALHDVVRCSLQNTDDLSLLQCQVHFFGFCMSAVLSAARSRPETGVFLAPSRRAGAAQR